MVTSISRYNSCTSLMKSTWTKVVNSLGNVEISVSYHSFGYESYCSGELATFLGTLDIHFSKRKWKQVFRLMDRSQEESNNTISFQEFFLFVFPQFVAAELQRQNEELKNERKRSEMTSGLYQLDNGSVSILSRVNMSFRRSTQILPPSFAVSPITPNHTSLDEINHPIPEENHNNPNQEDEKSSCDSESDGENNQGIAIQPDNTQEE
mmetsp:Transcript_1436/g.2315  ORF Transcript_1436/g.2315 Transcript_1436/m.2315 type:complete len:208 (+) Transcript_1436:306-929(+)